MMLMAECRSTWLSEPADEVDSGAERWRQLARQLKGDLSNIILMSEDDLQVQRGRPSRGQACPYIAKNGTKQNKQIRFQSLIQLLFLWLWC